MSERSEKRVSVHAEWVKPFFKNGYTEFSVVVETIRWFSGDECFGRDEMTTVLKTKDMEVAISMRDDMVKSGVLCK